MKIKVQNDFEKGLDHFLSKAFPEAALAFKQILQANSQDQVAQHFYHRSAQLALEGVHKDWTEVEEMESK